MDIINSLLKTGNKTANIDVKNCSLYIGYVSAVNIAFSFYPCDAMLARYLALSCVCLSIRLSDTSTTKMAIT